jgi:chaperonin cofactor prefoldin
MKLGAEFNEVRIEWLERKVKELEDELNKLKEIINERSTNVEL